MKLSTVLVFVPVATVAALFAVANRENVVVRFDPFARADAAFSMTMPLFLLAFGALLFGVLLGGATVALNRRAAQRRRLKTDEIGDAIVRIDSEKPADSGATTPAT